MLVVGVAVEEDLEYSSEVVGLRVLYYWGHQEELMEQNYNSRVKVEEEVGVDFSLSDCSLETVWSVLMIEYLLCPLE